MLKLINLCKRLRIVITKLCLGLHIDLSYSLISYSSILRMYSMPSILFSVKYCSVKSYVFCFNVINQGISRHKMYNCRVKCTSNIQHLQRGLLNE